MRNARIVSHHQPCAANQIRQHRQIRLPAEIQVVKTNLKATDNIVDERRFRLCAREYDDVAVINKFPSDRRESLRGPAPRVEFAAWVNANVVASGRFKSS